MVYPPTGSTAYEREMSTLPTLWSIALLYLLPGLPGGLRAPQGPPAMTNEYDDDNDGLMVSSTCWMLCLTLNQ